MNKEITIVVPCFNAESFIEECLHSILRQTHNVERIIVVDDASEDATVEVARAVSEKHPGIIDLFSHPERLGIPKNFNSGLKKVKTELVSVVAGDDSWYPTKLENEILLLSDDVECVYSACNLIDAAGNYVRPFKRKYDGDSGDILFQMLMHDMAFRNPLLRMSRIREIGYYYEGVEIFEDWQFKIEYLNGCRAAYCPKETVNYRTHPNGISKLSSGRVYYESLKKVYENVAPIINKLPVAKKDMVLERKEVDLALHLARTPK